MANLQHLNNSIMILCSNDSFTILILDSINILYIDNIDSRIILCTYIYIQYIYLYINNSNNNEKCPMYIGSGFLLTRPGEQRRKGHHPGDDHLGDLAWRYFFPKYHV